MHPPLEMSTLSGHDSQRAIIRLIRITFGGIIAQSDFAYKLQKSPVKGGRQIEVLEAHIVYCCLIFAGLMPSRSSLARHLRGND